jgi:hypothetical protein
MHPYEITQHEQVGSREEWRIHVDLEGYETVDDRPPFHTCDGVAREVAESALAWFEARGGDGIRFVERDGSFSWFYPWERVKDLRIMPMREAV